MMAETRQKHHTPALHGQKASAESEAGSQVIARAAMILRALEKAPQGVTLAALSREVDLPRTTVTRLVRSLQGEDLVSADGGSFRLGAALVRMAAAASGNVIDRLRSHADALSQALDETVDIWVERGDHAELVYEVVSQREVRIVSPSHFRLPLTTSAPGKVFLAQWSPPRSEADLHRLLVARTEHSHRSVASLRTDLEEIARCGVAMDHEEHAMDVCAVAMPVDVGTADRYALAVPVPRRRFDPRVAELESALRACVGAISRPHP